MTSLDRRQFLHRASLAIAATQLGIACTPLVQVRTGPSATSVVKSTALSSFGQLQQIQAGELNVGYADLGPSIGPVAILLHGWPYDIHSFVDAAPLLAAKGYRVVVPYLRGYGSTTFVSSDTFRNAQPSVVALDMVALMDALGVDKATFGGFDWGA